MNADYNQLAGLEGGSWMLLGGGEIGLHAPGIIQESEVVHCVVTYDFQPAPTLIPSFPGIRELRSPLSDY